MSFLPSLAGVVILLFGGACASPKEPRTALGDAQTSSARASGRSLDHGAATPEERELVAELRRLANDGGSAAAACKGLLVLGFRNDRMFEAGRIELSAGGAILLQRLAAVSAAAQAADADRPSLYTSGPLRVAGFPMDWELSSARAQNVVKTLEESDVSAQLEPTPTLCALGSGAARDDVPERRIEILVPASERLQRIYFGRSSR